VSHFYCYTDCHYAEYRYTDLHYAEWRLTDCHYTECRRANLNAGWLASAARW
jgi:hypothetical protein